MELFAKINNGFQPLIIFAKSFILGDSLCSKYAFANDYICDEDDGKTNQNKQPQLDLDSCVNKLVNTMYLIFASLARMKHLPSRFAILQVL